MKSTVKRITMLLSMLVVLTGSLYAIGERECKTDRCEGQSGRRKGGRSGNHLEKMVFMKAKMLLIHKDKLEITAEQEAQIKELVQSAKKQNIRLNAEIKIVEVDIHSILIENTIDTEKINKLIDKKYDLKKVKTKDIIKVISEFKNILTDEQTKLIEKLRQERRTNASNMRKGRKQNNIMQEN